MWVTAGRTENHYIMMDSLYETKIIFCMRCILQIALFRSYAIKCITFKKVFLKRAELIVCKKSLYLLKGNYSLKRILSKKR